ncbi:MAG: MiaB/RimO family radical SAM methylthiotransferase, partial [Bacteroidota bacterium]|nr:MiaB/RimO family radical SAM methylthiotransferase [Bacteroidota bacterium]
VRLREGPNVRISPIKETKRFIPSYSTNDRTRTFLKVQDGCDYFCSFCTIPLARGRSRSGSIAETLDQVKQIADRGVKEIVLTGVNTGDFGRSNNETFLQLIEQLDRIKGIDRFRISSIEPNLCSDQVIVFVAQSDRFVPHFHIPLQSGSDTILQRMRRRYDTALYRQRVERIKALMPHACIGVDVITGTPGETDQEFLKTHEFLRSIPIDHLHVFTYSERANTTAVRMDDSVPMEIRRDRTKQLRSLGSKLQREFYQRERGSIRRVLFERGEETLEGSGSMEGYTENYVRVVMPFDQDLIDRIVPVRLDRINGDGVMEGTYLGSEPTAAYHSTSNIQLAV